MSENYGKKSNIYVIGRLERQAVENRMNHVYNLLK